MDGSFADKGVPLGPTAMHLRRNVEGIAATENAS